jgi:hypothetical protein
LIRTLLVWLLLLALLGVELAVNGMHGGGTLTPMIGLAMAALVGFGFMRPRAAPRLAAVFALAGIFWLAVLLGLGGLDQATRHDIRIPFAYQRR